VPYIHCEWRKFLYAIPLTVSYDSVLGTNSSFGENYICQTLEFIWASVCIPQGTVGSERTPLQTRWVLEVVSYQFRVTGAEETLVAFSDIFWCNVVCTLRLSLQMAKVQSPNHTPVLISAPNIFLMVCWKCLSITWCLTCLRSHPCVVCCVFSLFISTK
jgi:hypothetical protein